MDVVYLEIVVLFYDFQGFGSIRSTQPTETHMSKMLHFLPNYFFRTIEEMSINPYGHYSYADTVYTRNVTPV